MTAENNTHSLLVGYILWIFGIFGAHRFYYGRQITGTIYFFTLGLLFIGWIVDLFLMPSLDRSCNHRYQAGRYDYTVTWILHTFLGLLGIHRFYLGKWITGLLWMVSGGLFGLGWLFDFLTLNEQVDAANRAAV